MSFSKVLAVLIDTGIDGEGIIEMAEAYELDRDQYLVHMIEKLYAVNCPPAAIAVAVEFMAGMILTAPRANRKAERKRARQYRERRALTDTAWYGLRNHVLDRDGPICGYCGSTEAPMQVDHITPLSRGGTNDPENLIPACGRCNASKRDKTVEEWQPPAGGWC